MNHFGALSDVEFEDLVADLLAAELGTAVERFAPGQDGGIDLRWRLPSGLLGIGQCKHYHRSRFADLLKAARGEVSKVELLAPGRYLFITSHDTTVSQKQRIYAILRRFMAGPEDVLGARDIAGLISRHQSIERSHPKMWLSSGQHLFWATHSRLASRAIALRDRIREMLPRYVPNRGYEKALALLDQRRVCIIAGVPGIGKTVLAHMLVAHAMMQGYAPIEVSGDIDEAWSALQGQDLQIFLYDDFLGQLSFAERFAKNEDRRLTDFVTKVAATKSKLLVLTTREYILQDARRAYERLDALDHRLHFILALEDYTRSDRARILYNHLWHAEVSQIALGEIASGGYRRIVDHPGYSPRLIEYCTGSGFDTQTQGYVERCVHLLDHPDRLWRNAFEHHLSLIHRVLATALAVLPPSVAVSDLRDAALLLGRSMGLMVTANEFQAALRVLEGSFIAFGGEPARPTVRFQNPSVRDFVLDWIADDELVVLRVLESASRLEQIERLYLYSGNRSRDVRGVDRQELLRVLERNADLFVIAIRRVFGSAPLEEDLGVIVGDRRTYGPRRGWYEERMSLLVGLPMDLRPDADWVEAQWRVAIDRWKQGVGDKEAAVQLMRSVSACRDEAEDAEVGSGLQQEAAAALDAWLETDLREISDDWLPYLSRLVEDKQEDLSRRTDLARVFEDYVFGEIRLWSPSPPYLDELREYAQAFGLSEVDVRLEQLQEEEAGREGRGTSLSSAEVRAALGRKNESRESDAELGKLFARLVRRSGMSSSA